MANNIAFCRVCGKEFVPCGKSAAEIGAFNYREVACSPECGQEYLKRVLEGRKPKTVEPVVEPVAVVEEPVIEPVILQEEVVEEVEIPAYKKFNHKRKDVLLGTEE